MFPKHPLWDTAWPNPHWKETAWQRHGRWEWREGRWQLRIPPNPFLPPWTLTLAERQAWAQWDAVRQPAPAPPPFRWQRETLPIQIADPATWDALCRQAATAEAVALDTETTGLDWRTETVQVVQLAWREGSALQVWVAPVGAWTIDWRTPLRRLIAEVGIVGHNLVFDSLLLDLPLHTVWDTQIAALLIQPARHQLVGLADLAQSVLRVAMPKETRLSDWRPPLTEEQIRYAAWDVAVTLGVFEHQVPRIWEAGLERVMDLEMRALPVVVEMTRHGVPFDVAYAQQQVIPLRIQAEQYAQAWATAVEAPRDLWGIPQINCNSDRQVLAALQTLGLPVENTNAHHLQRMEQTLLAKWRQVDPAAASGLSALLAKLEAAGIALAGLREHAEQGTLQWPDPPTTEPEATWYLQLPSDPARLAQAVEAIEWLLAYRAATKGVAKWEELLEYGKSGTLYPHYLQLVPSGTGRMATNKPQVQNIPQDPAFRRAVRAEPGRKLLIADFAAIELRVVTYLAGERVLYDMFQSGTDPHRAMAARIYRKAPEQVSKAERTASKSVSFGFLYGMGGTKFVTQNSRDLWLQGIPTSMADGERFRKAFRAQYPAIARWQQELPKQVEKSRIVRTLSGRRRIWTQDPPYNEILNTPCQGTAADILKEALWRVAEAIRPYGGRIRTSVHDEIVADCPTEHAEAAAKAMQAAMEAAGHWIAPVPVVVEVAIAETWADKH